jgi:hypothetical protein
MRPTCSEPWVVEDEHTRVILIYCEELSNGQEFIRAARQVTRKKPVVAIKSGVTQAGSRAASSHTGSLAGSEQAYQAAFRQAGVLQADSMESLFDVALAFGWIFQYMPIGRAYNLDLLVTPEQRAWMWRRAWEVVRERKVMLADFWNFATSLDGCISAGKPAGYLYITRGLIDRYHPEPEDEMAAQALIDSHYFEGMMAYNEETHRMLDPLWEETYFSNHIKKGPNVSHRKLG